jgi:hypothetical protein
MRRGLRGFITASGLMLSAIAIAEPRLYQEHYAVCDLPLNRQFAQVIAVGCQDIGTAVGCSTSTNLALKVRFTAPAGAQAKARLTVRNVSSLSLTPPPALVTGNTVTFNIVPGEFSIGGFSANADPAPVIMVSVQVAQSWLVGLQSQQSPPQKITLRFTQTAGVTPVSDIMLAGIYSACPPPVANGDFVIVPGPPARKSVVLVDGERSSCVTREAHLGAGIITIENLVPLNACSPPARAAIFGHQRAVDFQPNTGATWTPSNGDKLLGNKFVPVVERVGLWLLYANCVGGSCANRVAEAGTVLDVAEASLNLAKDRYQHLFGGITFDVVRKLDLTDSNKPKVEAARTLFCNNSSRTHDSIEAFRQVRSMFGWDVSFGKRLDIVFVRSGLGGEWCGTHATGNDVVPGSDLIVMTLLNDPFILAHEIGHALLDSGEHADSANGFITGTYNNLMRPAGLTGGYLTIGQLYRMNLLRNSALNRHGARPAANSSIVDCEGFGESEQCPALCFDVLRDVQPVISGGPQCAE